ncbi:MAG: adenylate kinase [bacterium]|nr:adenylate kinase [bacterium]
MALNVVFLGPPGVGKGTQAERLAGSRGLWHVSTGAILRACVRDGFGPDGTAGNPDLVRQTAAILKAGQLVPDDLMMVLIRETLAEVPAGSSGWLLDGFPRTAPQAEGLIALVAELGADEPIVLEIHVPDEEIVRRLSGRLTCSTCGHVTAAGAAVEGDDCRVCDGHLAMREDDRPETVRNRLMVFREKTRPAKDVLAARYRFERIDGLGSPNDVTQRIAGVLEAAS